MKPPPSRGISFIARSRMSPPACGTSRPACAQGVRVDREAIAGNQQATRHVPRDAGEHLAQIVGGQRLGGDAVAFAHLALDARLGAFRRSPSQTCTWPSGRIRSRYSGGPSSSCQQSSVSRWSARIASEIARTRSQPAGLDPAQQPGQGAREIARASPTAGRADRSASPAPCAACPAARSARRCRR